MRLLSCPIGLWSSKSGRLDTLEEALVFRNLEEELVGGAVAGGFFEGEENVASGFGVFVFLEEAGKAVVDFGAVGGAEFEDGLEGCNGVEIFAFEFVGFGGGAVRQGMKGGLFRGGRRRSGGRI